jgi:hypothetical protein
MVTFEELLIDPLLEKVKEVMSEHKNGDDPVHPIIIDDVSQKQISITGITKREYFAGLAMQGLCTPCIAGAHNINNWPESQVKAEMAVRLADALLLELSKERE